MRALKEWKSIRSKLTSRSYTTLKEPFSQSQTKKKMLKKNYLQFVCSRISVSRLLCYVFFYVQQLNAHIKKVVMILSLSFYHHPKRINNDFEICLKGLKTMKSCQFSTRISINLFIWNFRCSSFFLVVQWISLPLIFHQL